MQTNELNRKNINKLVVTFYTRVLQDEKLAPFFIEHLGEDMNSQRWEEHMQLLTDFWSTLVMGVDDYKGFPFPPHAQMQGLDREAFETWIKLFFESVDNIFTQEISMKFKEKSSIIASNFMRNLGI